MMERFHNLHLAKKIDHNLRHFARLFDPLIDRVPLWLILGIFSTILFYILCRNEK